MAKKTGSTGTGDPHSLDRLLSDEVSVTVAADDFPLHQYLTATSDAAYIWDLATDQIEWISDYQHTLSVELSSLAKTGDTFRARVRGDTEQLLHLNARDRVSHITTFDSEYCVLSTDGARHWVHDKGKVVLSDNGMPTRIIGSLRIINDKKKQESDLLQSVTHDDLTGLGSPLLLRKKLAEAINKARSKKQHGHYLMIGIDNLSMVNDAYGPHIAEDLIVGVAKNLAKEFRDVGFIGRSHTDHFGVIIDAFGNDELDDLLRYVLQSIETATFPTADGQNLQTTISIGCVEFPQHGISASDAMIHAESAFHNAKKNGRNCSRHYVPESHHSREQQYKLSLVNDVRQALENGQMALAFQPVVCAVTGVITFYECLLRVPRADGQWMPAKDFIAIAEQLSLTRQIDVVVLNRVLDILRQHPSLTLAMNISGFNALDGHWLQHLMGQVYRDRTLAQRLLIEITESAALNDLEETARFIQVVKSLGCRVVLDDFGEGQTSFKQMKKLPVDIIKVDGNFVHNLNNNKGHQLFIKTILEMAEGQHMSVTVECVENVEQMETLKHLGVHLLQGHFVGTPEMLAPHQLDAHYRPHLDVLFAAPEKTPTRTANVLTEKDHD